jgi:CheY-like chemotaxis protein
MVAQGLLMPYGMRVTLCGGGAEAVEAVKDKRFDMILMDHMMPDVDGIEAAARIRALDSPYHETVPIVALTANAVSGTKEMFLGAGFNDFLSKPIDVLKLNSVLERWIPKEKQQPIESSVPKRKHCPALDPKLLAAFRRDAEKAAVTMRETAMSGDIKAFTTAAHGMKSALAIIGEAEKSDMAFALEQAGLRGDREAIGVNLERFLESLAELVRCMTQAEGPVNAEPTVAEDTAFLTLHLQTVLAACADYDEEAAYSALDSLKERQWNKQTSAALEAIRELLFLQSDFEEAGRQAEKLYIAERHKTACSPAR